MRVVPVILAAAFVVLAACKKDDTTDGTATSTRSVHCEKSTCTDDNYCCGSDGWGDANCSPICSGGEHGIYCDDASDCQAGSVCCYVQTNGSITAASCLDACPTSDGHGQLCSAAAECAGKACRPLAILPSGLSSCQ